MFTDMNQEITEAVGLMKDLRAEWLKIEVKLLSCIKKLDYPIDVFEWIEENTSELKIAAPATEERSCISFAISSPGNDETYSVKTVPIDVLNKANDALQRAVDVIVDKIKTLKRRTKLSLETTVQVRKKLGIPDEQEAQVPAKPSGPIGKDMPITALTLSNRVIRSLEQAKVRTIGELTSLTERELKDIRGIGYDAVKKIKAALATYELTLTSPTDPKPVGNSIEILEPSVRLYFLLKRRGITTIEQLVKHTEQDLLSLQAFGLKSLKEAKELLDKRGLVLGKALEDQQGAKLD